MTARRTKATALALALILCGCSAGVPDLEAPELSVLGLTDMKMDLLSAQGTLRLRLANPNPDAIQLEGIRVALRAGGNRFAKGMAALDQSVPPYQTVTLAIPVTLSNLSLLRAAGDVGRDARRGSLRHGLDATITLHDSEGERHRLRVEKEGALDLGFLGGR